MEIVETLRLVVVPRAGVEPARPYGQRILSPQRLPFRHPGTRVKIACALVENKTLDPQISKINLIGSFEARALMLESSHVND